MFPHLFDPVALGASLKEVATDVIKTSEMDVTHRWFHSAKDADLFIWLDPGKNIIKQQLTFYGQVIEWNIVEGTRTGMILEEDGRKPAKASDIIRFDDKPQRAPVGQAIAVLQHVATLNDLERRSLAKNFADSPTTKSISPPEFLQNYGRFSKRKPRSFRLFDWFRKRFGR